MFRFASPHWLYALFVIVLIAVVFLYSRRLRRKNLRAMGNQEMMDSLMPEYSASRPVIRFVLLMLAATCVILALARPQFGSKLTQVKRKGIEMIIALDVSNSMLAEDIQPNRLERAKQAISQLVDRLGNDRIGLIVFAGAAYTQVPVTTDYVSVKQFLESIHPDMIPTQGTAIGAAIRLATSSFDPRSELKKAIIVISDGENHEDDAVEAAKQAYEKGIVVHTIGLGSPSGAPIPIPGQGPQSFMKDKSGQVVITKLDESLLNQVAAEGRGTYIRATNTRLGLNEIFEQLSSMGKKVYQAKIYSDYDDKFAVPVSLACFFLFLDLVMSDRKSKWLNKFRLFRLKL